MKTAVLPKKRRRRLGEENKVRHFGVSNMNRYQIKLLQSGLRQKLWVNQLQMSLAHTPLIDEGINVNTQFDGGVMRGAEQYADLNRCLRFTIFRVLF